MARTPRCCNCINFDFKDTKCSIYDKDIPNDILLEMRLCEYYQVEKQKSDENLPIAKGR